MSKNEERNELQYYLRALRHYPVIRDPEKVVQLIERWRNHGDRQAYDQLVCGNSRLVVSIALKYIGQGVPLPDLIQEGFIGLMKALNGFDPKLGSLSTYATWWIRSRILAQIPYIGTKRPYHLPIQTHQMVGLVAKALKNFLSQYGRWPDDQEVHALIHTVDGTTEETRLIKDMTMKNVRLCLRLVNEGCSSLDAPLGTNGEDNRSLGEVIADTTMDVDKIVGSRLELNKIETEINRLELRTQLILRSHLLEGITLGEIGKRFELSRERIRQIEKNGLEKIKSKLKIKNDKLKQLLMDMKEVGHGEVRSSPPKRDKQTTPAQASGQTK